MKGEMPSDFDAKAKEFIAKLQANPAKIASRKASQNAIEAFGPLLPEFLGGSADLAPSNLTLWSGSKAINEDAAGNYIHYGVREFGMTAIANGISLHGGFLPYTSTFLMFVAFPGDNLLWLRVSYFVIMYLCWDIVYTLQDVAIWSITAMSTPNPDERDNLVKWARTYGSVVFGIASMAIPMALEIFVKTTGLSWSVSIIIIVFILAFAGAGSSYKAYAIRERVPLAVKQESIKESFKLLKSNRILLLVSLSSILGAIGFGSSLVTYFFKYKITEEFINLPFIGALGMSTIFFTITSAPTFIAMLLVDKLKKICKDSFVLLLIAVQIICAVFRIIAYFIGFEGKMLWISMIVIAIGTLPTGVVSIAQTALFNDSIDLVEWKTGRRTEGMTFSMQTFFTKVSSGLNQGLAMLALSLMNYEAVDDSVPGAVLVGTQSQAFETWIWPLVILTPAIAAIAYVIPLLFIKYTKQQKQLVESDLEKRREGLPESGQSPYYREVLAPKFASVGATEADFENEN